jgi:[acyl-carrier-protein] S-malonyltransferase
MEKHVFLFPGQGSQHVGMGEDLHRNFPRVRELFAEASVALSMNFEQLCFEGPESLLVQTENVQPAITLVNVACLEVLKSKGITPAAAAGHSLGEYSALYAAGVMGFLELMKLVRNRGIFMRDAASRNPGGMIAVMGIGIESAGKVCKMVEGLGSVEIANHNSPGQIILSGETGALEKAMELAKGEGAKLVVPLKVSGPWHSRFMREARERMAGHLEEYSFHQPSIPVVANVSADYEHGADQIKENLVRQITSPVMWVDTIQRLMRDGYTSYIEVGPGRVLRGLVKDISRQANIGNVENVKTLEKFLEREPPA